MAALKSNNYMLSIPVQGGLNFQIKRTSLNERAERGPILVKWGIKLNESTLYTCITLSTHRSLLVGSELL